MWNLSYRWQRRARLGVGIVVLIGTVVMTAVAAWSSAAARAWQGLRECAAELRAEDRQLFAVDVPAELSARVGTLVYEDREDGASQVIGRVVAVSSEKPDHARLTIRWTRPPEDGESGGTLKGAAAPRDLRDTLRLLVSPDTVADESLRARDAIWPSISESMMPALTDNLTRELSRELASPDPRDQDLLAKTLQQLQQELKPLDNELAERLARRAWQVLGVKGLAAGLWNKTADKVQDQSAQVAQWWWRLFGSETSTKSSSRPFLSDETKTELQTALKDEARAFYAEHREQINSAVTRVLSQRRGDLQTAFKDRWADKLLERVLAPAWKTGEEQVLSAAQDYANDFASRRLLTRSGGPRVSFAYALRSSLAISHDPLLIFSPGGTTGRVEYEPLVR